MVTVEGANTAGIAARSPLAPAAIKQAGRNRWGEGLDTGPFNQRPLNAKSGPSIGKSAGLSARVTKIRQTARKPKPSAIAVRVNAGRPKFSIRIRETYSLADLARVLGVHHRRVESWAKRGLLGRARGMGADRGDIRFTELNVRRFIREHPREYDLGRVDKIWFRAMVFGDPGILRRRALRR